MLCCYAIGSLKDVLTCVKTNSNYFLYSFSLLQRTICASGSCQQHFVCKTTGHSAHTQHVTSTMINWLNTHPTLAWNEWIHEPYSLHYATWLLSEWSHKMVWWQTSIRLSSIWSSINLSIYPSMASERGRDRDSSLPIPFSSRTFGFVGAWCTSQKTMDEQNILAVNVYMHLHHMVLRCMIYDNPLYVPHNSINIWILNNICFGLKPTIYNRRMYL